jgi:hypothetical protein
MAFQEDSQHFGRKLGINYHLSRVKPCWFRNIIRPIKWSFMAVSKDEVGRHTGVGSKFIDTLDDTVRSREFNKMVAFENKARRKIEETIGALYVTRGAKANRRYSTSLHTVGWIIFFVDFAIGAKRGKAMMFDGQFIVLENLASAVSGRDTVGRREIIEPHHHMMKKMNQHNAWDLGIRKSAYDAATTFLDDTKTAFNFANVFCRCRCVECGIDVISDFFEFIIHEDGVDIETCMSIRIHNLMK